MSYRTRILMRWISILVVLWGQFGLRTFSATAQEPTAEPTSLPTPTPMATWTPTPTPTNTPDPAATPTVDPTAATRMVDFRVDTDEISPGDCVTFSWVVRGDIATVEFDQIGDGKVPVLVSDMDSRAECPAEETDYELIVTWLDGTKTTRRIEIQVVDDGSGGGNTSGGTSTPGVTSTYVAVTPIPVAGTPISVGGSTNPQTPVSGTSGTVVTPVGALGSVQVLPETGYRSPAPGDSVDHFDDLSSYPRRWPIYVVWLAVVLVIGVIGLALMVRGRCKSEVSR